MNTTEHIHKIAKDYSTTPRLIEEAMSLVGIKDYARFLKGTFSINEDVKARLLANRLTELKKQLGRKG